MKYINLIAILSMGILTSIELSAVGVSENENDLYTTTLTSLNESDSAKYPISSAYKFLSGGDSNFVITKYLESVSDLDNHYTFSGLMGFEFRKDNTRLGLSYFIEASEDITAHNVRLNYRYQF